MVIVDVSVIGTGANLTSAGANGFNRVLVLHHPRADVQKVDMLLDDEVTREPGKVVPVADLILQVAPTRLALPHPNRATIIAGLERNDLSDRAIVDALNSFTESVGVPKAQA